MTRRAVLCVVIHRADTGTREMRKVDGRYCGLVRGALRGTIGTSFYYDQKKKWGRASPNKPAK